MAECEEDKLCTRYVNYTQVSRLSSIRNTLDDVCITAQGMGFERLRRGSLPSLMAAIQIQVVTSSSVAFLVHRLGDSRYFKHVLLWCCGSDFGADLTMAFLHDWCGHAHVHANRDGLYSQSLIAHLTTTACCGCYDGELQATVL